MAQLIETPKTEMKVKAELVLHYLVDIFYDQPLNLNHYNPTSSKVASI